MATIWVIMYWSMSQMDIVAALWYDGSKQDNSIPMPRAVHRSHYLERLCDSVTAALETNGIIEQRTSGWLKPWLLVRSTVSTSWHVHSTHLCMCMWIIRICKQVMGACRVEGWLCCVGIIMIARARLYEHLRKRVVSLWYCCYPHNNLSPMTSL